MTDETFSAKQVARRIGTDAKTFRKWLRSSSSPYAAVGQGKRYEFPQNELAKIRLHFEVWKNKSARKNPVVKANGVSHPKVNEEPPMKRLPDSSLVPRDAATPESKRQKKLDYEAERQARGKARDEEYGTIDGEYPEEPTDEELENIDLEELED